MLEMIQKYNITLNSIGKGTASYETEEFVSNLLSTNNLQIPYLIVYEAGESVYSASNFA